MKTSLSFFKDFVDNSDLRLGNALLTQEGRVVFDRVKFQVGCELDRVIINLPRKREDKLLKMAMIQHAISQILYEIAKEEDGIVNS